MGLIPPIAKWVPVKLRRFCEGLRYPHTFLFMLPAFIIALLLTSYIPYSQEVLTVMGIALFFFSKSRWD